MSTTTSLQPPCPGGCRARQNDARQPGGTAQPESGEPAARRRDTIIGEHQKGNNGTESRRADRNLTRWTTRARQTLTLTLTARSQALSSQHRRDGAVPMIFGTKILFYVP